MNRSHYIKILSVSIIALCIGCFISMGAVRITPAKLPDSFAILQVIDENTFPSLADSNQWYNSMIEITTGLRKHTDNFSIILCTTESMQKNLKEKEWPQEVVFINDDSILHDPLVPVQYSSVFNQYSLIDGHECVLSIHPMLLEEIYKTELSEERFYDHILGIHLAPMIYLYSYFDTGVFRIAPRAAFYKNHSFNMQLAIAKQKQWIAENYDYLTMISNRAFLISFEQLQESHIQRMEYCIKAPSTPILEAGFFSAGLGEQFWQDRVWNYNARYIIEPSNFNFQHAHTPYASTLSFEQVQAICPSSSSQILKLILYYNDKTSKNMLPQIERSMLNEKIEQVIDNISWEDKNKIAALLGDDFFIGLQSK